MNMKKPFLLISLFFLIVSCQQEATYSEVREFDNNTWAYGEWVEFNPEIQDTSIYYNIHFTIKHEKDYPFQNIYLRQKMSGSSLNQRIDTLSIDLISPNGKWKGKCNKKECTQNVLLAEKVKFNKNGSYSIAFEQFTRKDKLPGILEIGLEISSLPANKNN